MKQRRLQLNIGQKQMMCKYKAANPSATINDVAAYCKSLWSVSLSSSTIGDILRASEKWLSVPDNQLKYSHYLEPGTTEERRNRENSETDKVKNNRKQAKVEPEKIEEQAIGFAQFQVPNIYV